MNTITSEAITRSMLLFNSDKEPVKKTFAPGQDQGRVDVGAYLHHYKISYRMKNNGSGTFYILDQCPFDSSHGKDSAIIQNEDGKLGFKCFHDGCHGKDWQEVRNLISGDDRLTQFCSFPEKTPSKAVTSAPKQAIPWPSPLAPEAFHGLAGEFVKMIEPHTEADPVALLIQFLVGFGNVIGRGSWFEVEADSHHLNLNAALVGETSKGRKGTANGQVKKIFKAIDPEWAKNSKGGMSSGEGLIWAVRDPIYKKDRDKKTKEIVEIMVDEGVEDKRLLVIEEELASTLRVMERDGNTLSALVRKAWDDGNLASLTKNSPAQATGAHISIVGHITKDELRRYLTSTESGNGFANRFIWLCVKRSKVLPEGGRADQINWNMLIMDLKGSVEFGRDAGKIEKSEEAKKLWAGVYPELSEGKPGLFGAVTSRAEAQVMRLACIYAVLDKSETIEADHLLAALALWDYAEASARYIFGDATGDRVADQILEALRGSPEGMTRTEISGLFYRNRSADRIEQSLTILTQRGLIQKIKESTEGRGRSLERWMATAVRELIR